MLVGFSLEAQDILYIFTSVLNKYAIFDTFPGNVSDAHNTHTLFHLPGAGECHPSFYAKDTDDHWY
jgi:hypothetical protein